MKIRTPIAALVSTLLVSALLGACNGDEPLVRDARADEAAVPTASAPARSAPEALGGNASVDGTDGPAAAEPLAMTVYKSPTCGCCKGWVTYMQEEGFAATGVDTDDVDTIKADNGLTDPALKSCHTALIGGYVIEGHVPAADVRRLLEERPDVAGLTAPGMPAMSPGMGSREPKDYDVLAFRADGSTRVWSSY